MTSIPQWTLMTKMFTKATKLKPPEPRNEFETNRRLPSVIPEVVGRWKAREQENKWHQSSHTTFLLHVRHLDRAIKFSRSIPVSQLIKEHQCYKLTGVSCVLSDLQLLQFSVNRFWPGVQVIQIFFLKKKKKNLIKFLAHEDYHFSQSLAQHTAKLFITSFQSIISLETQNS